MQLVFIPAKKNLLFNFSKNSADQVISSSMRQTADSMGFQTIYSFRLTYRRPVWCQHSKLTVEIEVYKSPYQQ